MPKHLIDMAFGAVSKLWSISEHVLVSNRKTNLNGNKNRKI